jgi:hypothetical protein
VNVRSGPLNMYFSFCVYSDVDVPEDGLITSRSMQHTCEGNLNESKYGVVLTL